MIATRETLYMKQRLKLTSNELCSALMLNDEFYADLKMLLYCGNLLYLKMN